jgi:hypothetical protein
MPYRRMQEWRYSSTILDFGTRWGKWWASPPGGFTSGESAPGTHWIVGWVGLTSGLDAVSEGKCPALGIRTPAVQPVARRYTDWANPAHLRNKVKIKLSLCLIKNHALKTHQGSWGITPRFLNYSIGWKWVVSFTPWPLYLPRKEALPHTHGLGEKKKASAPGGNRNTICGSCRL